MVEQDTNASEIGTCLNGYRDHATRAITVVVPKETEEVATLLDQNGFYSAKVITIPFGSLASCIALNGIVGVVDEGGAEAWSGVDLGAHYRYWQVKFAIGARLKAIHQSIYAMTLSHRICDIASLLCYYYVHEQAGHRDELWKFLQIVASNPEVARDGYWDYGYQGQYELFVLKLFAQTPFGKGVEVPAALVDKSLGPYQSVLDHWNKQEDFAEALRGICDFHCQNLRIKHSIHDEIPPFDTAPFDLVPYEILAIYKLRAEQGLETPEIEHPLLALPTASREPRELTKIDDPIFKRIEKLYVDQCLN